MPSSVIDKLLRPVDIAWLVFFRLFFGAIMIVEVYRYWSRGWIDLLYIEPGFYFTYYGFAWVSPWPGEWMYVHFAGLGILATLILLGLAYRFASTLFFLAFTYVFLLDQTQYLNHFYLLSLISLLMIFVPAHRAFSLDARIRSQIRRTTTPVWTLWTLRLQLGVAYFYAGIAKINGDWLRGVPLDRWLEHGDLGRLGLLQSHWVAVFFSWAGLALDLLIVPALLWRRTRLAAFGLITLFHLMNSQLFSIGIFPWFMIGATTVFLSPSWPRQVWTALRRRDLAVPELPRQGTARLSLAQRWGFALLALYAVIQLLAPLRHLAYPGNVAWTEEGHRFSWRMKLRDKRGRSELTVVEQATGEVRRVDPKRYLTSRQAGKMSVRPDMVLQFAHHLAKHYEGRLGNPVRVYGQVEASLNYRPLQLLIDPDVDLASQPRDLAPASWILPLE